MAYTRPTYNAADAGFLPDPYTRPAYNAADATFYAPSVSIELYLTDGGLPSDPTFEISPVITVILQDSGLPSSPVFLGTNGTVARLSDGGLPSAPSIFIAKGKVAWIYDGGLPLPPTFYGYSDPTPYIDFNGAIQYVMDLVIDGALVRVPISSWQATQQTDQDNYVQCVVPACAPYLDQINASSEFVISCVGNLLAAYGTGQVENPLVRGPVQTVQVSRGATNQSAVISGYTDALPTIADPDPAYDRTLVGIRSVSTYGTTISVRCSIDWLLRPGQRALFDSTQFVASYVNYYVTGFSNSIDAYMDVGYRSQ